MPNAPAPLARLSAPDVADGLLCVLVLERGSALTLTPGAHEYEVTVVRESRPAVVMTLPLPLGHAVAARLGILAGLDPWGVGDHLGQLDVRVGGVRGEYLVALHETPSGFVAEARRLVEQQVAATSTAEVRSGRGRIGPYHIERELGRGSMGIVYRARRDGQDGAVAVKLLNPAIAMDPAMSARFVREGRAAALVNDPGVVGVSDFGRLPDGQAYLVMELVEGPTLEDELQAQGALVPGAAVRVAVRVLMALEAAHVRGVVHRDLKPSNVFLTPGEQVKIADFGAALVDDRHRSGQTSGMGLILGTPAYMAPEQALAQPIDDRADLYSVGCMLFRMLCGAPPFKAAALLEVLRQQIEDAPPPAASPHGSLPDALVVAVARALAKRPDDRFRSAGEMRSALEACLPALGAADRKEGRR